MAVGTLHLFSEPAKTSLEQLPFLDESIVGLMVFIALYFGYSRLVFVGILLLLPALSPLFITHIPKLNPLLNADNVTLGIISASCWLLWQNDKGFRFKNILIAAIQIIGVIAVTLLVADYALLPSLDLSPFLAKLGIEKPIILTNQTLLFSGFTITSLVISIVKPSTINVSLLTMMLTLAVLTSFELFTQTPMVTGLYSVIGLLLTVGLLIESRQMAFRDQLTEIPSRMALQQYIGTLGSRYVVVMADIDHFKKFNDTHGHDIGDQVLKLVAKKIASVSGGGKAFRYGGEEFTIIFADKEAQQMMPFVEQVRTNIENYPLVLREKDRPKKKPPTNKNKPATSKHQTAKKVYVTASFGVAEATHKSQRFEHVMKQADNALYKAKKAGRNCVRTA